MQAIDPVDEVERGVLKWQGLAVVHQGFNERMRPPLHVHGDDFRREPFLLQLPGKPAISRAEIEGPAERSMGAQIDRIAE